MEREPRSHRHKDREWPWQKPHAHLEEIVRAEHHMLNWVIRAQVAQGKLLVKILDNQEKIMADLSALEAELAEVKTSADAALAAVEAVLVVTGELKVQNADLKAQIDALVAGQVTQDQIDALTATAAGIDTTVDTITTAATPVV
jgi:hypothetical protein